MLRALKSTSELLLLWMEMVVLVTPTLLPETRCRLGEFLPVAALEPEPDMKLPAAEEEMGVGTALYPPTSSMPWMKEADLSVRPLSLCPPAAEDGLLLLAPWLTDTLPAVLGRD